MSYTELVSEPFNHEIDKDLPRHTQDEQLVADNPNLPKRRIYLDSALGGYSLFLLSERAINSFESVNHLSVPVGAVLGTVSFVSIFCYRSRQG